MFPLLCSHDMLPPSCLNGTGSTPNLSTKVRIVNGALPSERLLMITQARLLSETAYFRISADLRGLCLPFV